MNDDVYASAIRNDVLRFPHDLRCAVRLIREAMNRANGEMNRLTDDAVASMLLRAQIVATHPETLEALQASKKARDEIEEREIARLTKKMLQ